MTLDADVPAACPGEPQIPAGLVAETLAELTAQHPQVLVVLDDDPTGTRSVADSPVLTHWEVMDFGLAFAHQINGQGVPVVYLLTNIRSLDPEEAATADASESTPIVVDIVSGTDLRTELRGDPRRRTSRGLRGGVLGQDGCLSSRGVALQRRNRPDQLATDQIRQRRREPPDRTCRLVRRRLRGQPGLEDVSATPLFAGPRSRASSASGSRWTAPPREFPTWSWPGTWATKNRWPKSSASSATPFIPLTTARLQRRTS